MEVAPATDGQRIQLYTPTVIGLAIANEQRHLDFSHGNQERSHDIEIPLHLGDFIVSSEGNLCLLLVHIYQKYRVL